MNRDTWEEMLAGGTKRFMTLFGFEWVEREMLSFWVSSQKER